VRLLRLTSHASAPSTPVLCSYGPDAQNAVTAASAAVWCRHALVRDVKAVLSRGDTAEQCAVVRATASPAHVMDLPSSNAPTGSHENLWSYDDWAHHLAALAHMCVILRSYIVQEGCIQWRNNSKQ
jgi:hypothetical protein